MIARPGPGPSLFLRIFLVLLMSVLAAGAVNFAFLLLLPPPSLPIHHLGEIRAALQTGQDPSGQLLVRLGRPPAAADEPPPIKALRERLVTALNEQPNNVRLSVMRGWAPGRWFVPRTFSMFHRRRELVRDPRADLVVGRFIAARHLPAGQWRIVTSADPGFRLWLRQTLLSFLAIVLAVAAPAWLLARRLTAPLRLFAAAAERLGRDPHAPPLAIRGPPEVIPATQALNEMQKRLSDYIDDRTTLITAIAHDLRTPLMRLAFRLEAAPPELRARVEPDIAEMEAMIASALVFARETRATGQRQRVDLRSLIESLADSMTDQGHDVQLLPGAEPIVTADSLALRALFCNLLENAVRYGLRARVTLKEQGQWAQVEIDDDGPGVAETELDRVFEPFYRAEPSRSRDTGGTGLGLAIVRAIAKSHEGEVFMVNRGGGGLRVTVVLPRCA